MDCSDHHRHDGDPELINALSQDRATCPVCQVPDDTKFFLSKDGYDLYKCAGCRHLFVWPIPTIEALKQIYSFANLYQVQDRVIYADGTAILEKNRKSLEQIEKFSLRRGRLLDVGCSSGRFLWLAKQNGWSVYGVELNKDTAQIAKDNGIEVFVGELSSADYPLSSFDAIHVGDVIEHVQDPAKLLTQASALLDPDGVIALVTPNHDAVFPMLTYWLYRLFRIPWSHSTPPYHLSQFSEESLGKLLEKLNLKVIYRQYRPCDLRYELGETHVLRSFRRARGERRLVLAAGRLLYAAFAAVAYAVAYGVDHCCVWKKKDFEMLFIVRKASCC